MIYVSNKEYFYFGAGRRVLKIRVKEFATRAPQNPFAKALTPNPPQSKALSGLLGMLQGNSKLSYPICLIWGCRINLRCCSCCWASESMAAAAVSAIVVSATLILDPPPHHPVLIVNTCYYGVRVVLLMGREC